MADQNAAAGKTGQKAKAKAGNAKAGKTKGKKNASPEVGEDQ